MIPANDDWGFHAMVSYQLIEAKPSLGSFPVAQPADSCRQPLKRNLRRSVPYPILQCRVIRKQFQNSLIRNGNVFGVPAQGDPTEWSVALAEQRPDIFGNEPLDQKGVLDALLKRHRSNVVSVVKYDAPPIPEIQQ